MSIGFLNILRYFVKQEIKRTPVRDENRRTLYVIKIMTADHILIFLKSVYKTAADFVQACGCRCLV